MSSPAITIVAWLAVIMMAFAALADVVRAPDAALVKSDFAAFYCGALVVRTHADPYALTPIAGCEASNVDIPGGAVPSAVGVDPDPLPGYDMAFFMPFTELPYREAAIYWDLLLVGAIIATCILMARLTELPFIVIAAIFSFIDGVASIPFGQTAPVVTFGLALAAYGLARERQLLTVIGAALTMLVPQVGVPVCCAIFLWRRELRLGIGAVGVVLATTSFALLGVALNVEYLQRELPTHALAESTTSIQYSLTWLLHYFGVNDATAIRVAAIQYAIFAVGGVILAPRVARALGSPNAIALFPAAIALIGGSFIHIQQMAAAVPFALVLTARTRHPLAWTALMLLVLPWPAEAHLVAVGAMAIAGTIALAAVEGRSLRVAAGIASLIVVAYAVIAGPVMTHLVPAVPQHLVAATPSLPLAVDGDRLASAEDAREVRTDPGFAVATPRTLASRLPIWVALCTIAGLTLRVRSTLARDVLT
jgi:hypothetical protein